MGLFRKKKPAEQTKADRELIEDNSKAIDVLIVLAQSNTELIGTLKELQEKLKYLIPSENPKVMDADKAIKNKIDDLRIALNRTDDGQSKKSAGLLTDIQCLIAERNTKL